MLKEGKPMTGLSARTEAGRLALDPYIRAAQWRRLVSTEDRWPACCNAAIEHMVGELQKRETKQRDLHPLAWHRKRVKRGSKAPESSKASSASQASPLQATKYDQVLRDEGVVGCDQPGQHRLDCHGQACRQLVACRQLQQAASVDRGRARSAVEEVPIDLCHGDQRV